MQWTLILGPREKLYYVNTSFFTSGSVNISQSSLVLPRPPEDLPLSFYENLAKEKEAICDLNIGQLIGLPPNYTS